MELQFHIYPSFGGDDVATFLLLIGSGKTTNNSTFKFILNTPHGTFALAVNDMEALMNKYTDIDTLAKQNDFISNFDNNLEDFYTHANAYINELINQLEDLGITLLKAEDHNLDCWNALASNSHDVANPPIEYNPCAGLDN